MKRQRGKSSGNCAAKGQSINISMSTDTNFIDLTYLKIKIKINGKRTYKFKTWLGNNKIMIKKTDVIEFSNRKAYEPEKEY